MAITVKSSAFSQNERIPPQYTGDGQDISPPLTWKELPEAAAELALICDDPDAPTPEPWVHWLIYKIPAGSAGLAEAVPPSARVKQPEGALQGQNTFGSVGYGGPAPPEGHGTHHYHFKLYALDQPLDIGPGVDKKTLLEAMAGHIVGEGELVGTYQR